jgi:transcriptional regulator with XRE-family HTH domain
MESVDIAKPLCNTYYMRARRRQRESITSALRRAINESDLSFQQIERDTGVLRQSLMKFARGEQSLRLDIADTLAEYFGLEIVQRKDN